MSQFNSDSTSLYPKILHLVGIDSSSLEQETQFTDQIEKIEFLAFKLVKEAVKLDEARKKSPNVVQPLQHIAQVTGQPNNSISSDSFAPSTSSEIEQHPLPPPPPLFIQLEESPIQNTTDAHIESTVDIGWISPQDGSEIASWQPSDAIDFGMVNDPTVNAQNSFGPSDTDSQRENFDDCAQESLEQLRSLMREQTEARSAKRAKLFHTITIDTPLSNSTAADHLIDLWNYDCSNIDVQNKDIFSYSSFDQWVKKNLKAIRGCLDATPDDLAKVLTKAYDNAYFFGDESVDRNLSTKFLKNALDKSSCSRICIFFPSSGPDSEIPVKKLADSTIPQLPNIHLNGRQRLNLTMKNLIERLSESSKRYADLSSLTSTFRVLETLLSIFLPTYLRVELVDEMLFFTLRYSAGYKEITRVNSNRHDYIDFAYSNWFHGCYSNDNTDRFVTFPRLNGYPPNPSMFGWKHKYEGKTSDRQYVDRNPEQQKLLTSNFKRFIGPVPLENSTYQLDKLTDFH